jgi:hypothetical protein
MSCRRCWRTLLWPTQARRPNHEHGMANRPQ